LKFLIDQQLPPALARMLQSEFGCPALHVLDLGLEKASDQQLWTYAGQHDLVLVSKDEDFSYLTLSKASTRFVWVRFGNCRRVYLLERFRELWPQLKERLDGGDRFVELR
jgi:predicted nuclease of predicted toxin-antitoxin system